MNGSVFYRNDRSSSGRSLNRNTPPGSSSSRSQSSENSDLETPLSRRRHENAMASSISACQNQLTNVLKKLEETTDVLATLSGRIERVEQKVTEIGNENEDSSQKAPTKGKRKRPKDSLTIQEEVHKLHANREERNQYKGLQGVNSPHNKAVTDYITRQLKSKGLDEIKVERASKKYHEHIRRVAQGKVDDDVKARMKMANRKSRKYLQRKKCLDLEKEKEVAAFNSLSKDHMSSDEDDVGQSQWLSRPPTYRSETLQKFLNKLDKVHNKRARKETKFAKKIKRTVGEPKEVEPPENTPVWAISSAWIANRQRSMNQVNQDMHESSFSEDEDTRSDESAEESDLDFED